MPAPLVLSIQSQVVYGHVGNGAAVPALQRLGCEVLAVPTVLLSHHPGHGPPRGRPLPQAEVADLLAGLAAAGILPQCSALLSGYLGHPGNGEAVLSAIAALKRGNPGARILCDPVIGDADSGIYVDAALPAFFRERLMPSAEIVTPNLFEMEQLTGRHIEGVVEVRAAADQLRGRGPGIVVCTSLPLTEGIGTLAVAAEGAWMVATPLLQPVPHGSGDLFAALLLGRLLQGKTLPEALALAVSATFAVLCRSLGAPELHLVEAADLLAAPPEVYPAAPL